MTPLSSNRQNTGGSSYTISNPLPHIYSSPQRFQAVIDSFYSWTPKFSSVPDNTLLTSEYKKTTDHHLHWDRHHNLSAKYSVFNTLIHRAKTVYANIQLLHKDKEHIRSALLRCKYPIYALNRLQTSRNYRQSINQAQNNNNNHSTNNHNNAKSNSNNENIYLVIPYTKGLSKRFKNIYGKVGVQVHFKGGNTIKNPLVAPKIGTT